MHQGPTSSQTFQIAQLLDPIGRQDQRGQIRDLLGDPLVDGLYPVPRKQERVEPWGEREAGQGGDVVVCKVDGILRARDAEVLNGGDFVACRGSPKKEGRSGQLCSLFCLQM